MRTAVITTTAIVFGLMLTTPGCTMGRHDAENAKVDRQIEALRAGEMRGDSLDRQQLREDANDESLMLEYILD
jgi:hypothetical protein